MLKRILLILMCMGCLISAAQNVSSVGASNALTVAGVSKELAEYRAATISNLRYHIKFCIPSQKQAPVRGAEAIRFDLKAPTQVILDFRADNTKVFSVEVNGKSVSYTFENEHIVIPSVATRSGHNVVKVSFEAGDQSLNRSDDYLYTLFVPDRARTAFPCMDQPDLKARYILNLDLPAEWTAVSNTIVLYDSDQGVSAKSRGKVKGAKDLPACEMFKDESVSSYKCIEFAESEPLPTYLFAFAAGRFSYKSHTEDGRTIGAYYRETDPERISQLPEIFRQVEHALKWQEEFTGVPYPFAKYDLVILPGFQFGGMEHTGATFYNDNTIFLSANPTPDEILSRANLIAHETTHMWFGDYVTMRWFNDVWTKEVFANYFAAEITAPLFPDVNHSLNRLKTYAAAAYSEDRTWFAPLTLANGERLIGGGTSIRQSLGNLRNAGLVYNNIIYNKAPLVMYKLVEMMGPEAFREGIREYVRRFSYGNATWDELVEILDNHTPADVKAFSHAWVDEPGMPTINIGYTDNGALAVEQIDPYGRQLSWPQWFGVMLHKNSCGDTIVNVRLTSDQPHLLLPLPEKWHGAEIVANCDGRGYGIFQTSDAQLFRLLTNWNTITSGTARQATLMNLYENYLAHRITNEEWLSNLASALKTETDPLTASTMCSYLREPMLRLSVDGRAALIAHGDRDQLNRMQFVEAELIKLSTEHPIASVRTQLLRVLMHVGMSRETVSWLRDLWEKADNPFLSERDYMSLSYEVAIRQPADAEEIVAKQRQSIEHPADGKAPNADRLREFDFISRAVLPSRHRLDALFDELLTPEGRRIEPWAARTLSLMNHPLREGRSVGYIRPALEALEDVQRTGDIFFPANWCSALLGEHIGDDARREVEAFLNAHPDYLPLRRNKVLNGAYGMFR